MRQGVLHDIFPPLRAGRQTVEEQWEPVCARAGAGRRVAAELPVRVGESRAQPDDEAILQRVVEAAAAAYAAKTAMVGPAAWHRSSAT